MAIATSIDPWNIIGWIVLTCLVLGGLVAVVVAVAHVVQLAVPVVKNAYRHLRTYRLEPKKDDWWTPAFGKELGYRILHVDDVGVRVEYGSCSWWDSDADWKKRVNKEYLYREISG